MPKTGMLCYRETMLESGSEASAAKHILKGKFGLRADTNKIRHRKAT